MAAAAVCGRNGGYLVKALCDSKGITHRKFHEYLLFSLQLGRNFFKLATVRESVGLSSLLVPLAGLRCNQGGFARAKVAEVVSESPRAIASRRGRQSSGAGRLSRGHARQAVGMGGQASFAKTCLPVDPPSSLRSAADRTGFGRLFGAGCGRKVRLGLAPERSGAVVGAPPGWAG
jgi:hypothetical protein